MIFIICLYKAKYVYKVSAIEFKDDLSFRWLADESESNLFFEVGCNDLFSLYIITMCLYKCSDTDTQTPTYVCIYIRIIMYIDTSV